MTDFPLNIPSDDALTMLDAEGPHPAAMSDPGFDDDDDDTEDPVGRGQSRAGRKDMFVARPWREGGTRRVRGGNSTPAPGGLLLTPRARQIP